MAEWTPSGSKMPKSSRKKWDLGDRETLQNQIKHRFAEDGHPETQYLLARKLLAEVGDDPDTKANHEQGVYWLMRATNQGHNDAFQLLQQCQIDAKGITRMNEADVCDSLRMSPGERAARRAAKEVFNYLSNGDKFITVAQLERKLREIYRLDKKGKMRHTNGAISNGDIAEPLQLSPRHEPGISEASLIAAAVHYSHGHMPTFEDSQIVISVPHPDTLAHIPCFHRPFFNPVMFFLLLYHRFITLISSLPGTLFSNLQLIIVLTMYFIFSFNDCIRFIPLLTYYLTFGIMIITTFKILKKKHEFVDFRIWSGLFLQYGDPQIDVDESENRFLRNNIGPFVIFFVAFILNLTVLPLIEWLPCSELTVVSFAMSFITLFSFIYTTSRTFHDYSILVSFGLNVLAKYPYEMDSVVTTGWRYLDLHVPAFTTFVIGNGIEFCINCRALLYFTIPGCLLYLASRDNWRGIWKYLLPHCISLSWLQICITNSESATTFGILRAALGLSGMIFFLPLFGLATLLIPVFATIEWLSLTDPTIRLWTAVIATVLGVGGSCILAGFNRTERYITAFQVFICLTAIVFLTGPYMQPEYDETSQDDLFPSDTALSWDNFYKYCNQPAWQTGVTKIKTQIRCSHLMGTSGTRIHWEGDVTEVEITRIYNFRLQLIQKFLPHWLANILICFYGEENKVDCSDSEDCEVIKRLIDDQSKCNLDKWNSYDYAISVRMSTGIIKTSSKVIQLKASHIFSNFTEHLNAFDRIWFKGILKTTRLLAENEGTLGTKTTLVNPSLDNHTPVIELTAIGCNSCNDKGLEAVVVRSDEHKANPRLKDLRRGVKYLLNVLFNPVVTFK